MMGPSAGTEKLNSKNAFKKDSFFDSDKSITDKDPLIPTRTKSDFAGLIEKKSVDRDPRNGSRSEAGKTKTLLDEKTATRDQKGLGSKISNTDKKSNSSAKAQSADKSEQTEVRSKEVINPKETQEKKTSERQKVMLKFMDSFESEFGVPREKIVEAMTNLSNSDLVSNPESSADDVIANLDLPEEKQEQALAMYLAMLGTLKVLSDSNADPIKTGMQYGELSKSMAQAGLNKNASASSGLLNADKTQMDTASIEQASKFNSMQGPNPNSWSKEKLTSFQSADGSQKGWMSSKEKQHVLNESLDNMNRKFFMQDSNQVFMQTQNLPATNFENGQNVNLQGFENLNSLQNGNDILNSAESSTLSIDQQNDLAAKLSALMGAAAGLSALSNQSGDGEAGSMSLNKTAKGNLNGDFTNSDLNGFSSDADLGLNNSYVANNRLGDAEFSKNNFGNSYSDSNGFNSKNAKDSDSSSGEGDSDSRNMFAAGAASGLVAGHKSLNADNYKLAGSQSANLNGPVTDQQNQQNLQAIMKQAQYLIKRGGGEAKVQMNPDGLGPVHVRVLVEDGGKLNVELSAKTKEAKEALEDSLVDLKSKLHEHKYSVESIKVDLGSDIKSELGRQDSQKMHDAFKDLADFKNQQQQQEQSRQFLQQFHQENLFKRDTAWDLDNPNGYRSQPQQLQPLKPASGQGISAQSVGRYKGISKGQGLDLVA